jgi:mRNA interferase RelE/StbE
MSLYKLKFTKISQKEWKKLGSDVRQHLKKKLLKRLENPRVQADKLSGYENIYKIKLRSSGFRLAYEVKDEEIVILVLKIGKRDKFYETLQNYL